MKPNVKTFAGILLKYVIPPIVTVGLCWMLLRDIDLSEMRRVVSEECVAGWLLASLALNVGAQIARALRWQIQLRALGVRPSLWVTSLSIFGTYAVNLLFPRLGEVWRTGFIARREKAQFSEVFGSMVADRLSDTLCVGLLTLLTFVLAGPQLSAYLAQDPEKLSRIMALVGSPWVWAAVGACVAGGLWLWFRCPENKIVSRLRRFAAGLWEGFAVIRGMKGLGWWLALTVMLWGCYYCGLGCALMAFPLTARVVALGGATALLVCFVVSSLSMAVPSNGGIGPYQWALMWALSLYASQVEGLTWTYSAIVANTIMAVTTLMQIFLGVLTFGWIALSKTPQR